MQLIGIFISPAAGAPMQALTEVQAIAGKGLEGDRYAAGEGASLGPRIRHVSLIEFEEIAHAAASFEPAQTRRNLLTQGVDLKSLLGREFKIGEVRMLGIEVCRPCDRPSQLSKKPGFKQAFQGGGGIRAEILESGMVRIDDPIIIETI